MRLREHRNQHRHQHSTGDCSLYSNITPQDLQTPGAHTIARLRSAARLTGRSAWQGLERFYLSDNLTYAVSIAYYSLLSLFPLILLAFALLGQAAGDPGDRNAVLELLYGVEITVAYARLRVEARSK